VVERLIKPPGLGGERMFQQMRAKKIVFASLLGMTVFGTAMGSAASLGGITADGLGADDTIVASCDTDGVTTSYTTAYNTTSAAGYKVATVTVGGLNNACDGKTIEVRLTGSSSSSLETISKTVETDAASTNTTLTFGSSTLAENVTGVHIVVAG
jgi:hypothetical protein